MKKQTKLSKLAMEIQNQLSFDQNRKKNQGAKKENN